MTEPGKVKIYTVCTRSKYSVGMARTAQEEAQKAGIDFFQLRLTNRLWIFGGFGS